MKMNKKGFTLIELLAVIVILAIVALVATPVITTTISRAKQSAAIASANNVITAINNNEQMANFEAGELVGDYKSAVKVITAGVDANGNGDYADTGDTPPVYGIDKESLTAAMTSTDFKISGDNPTAVNLVVTKNIVASGTIEISGYCVQVEKGKAVAKTSTNVKTTKGSC